MKPYENLSLEDMEGEVWKDVVGYEGLYQVSNLGRVKSLDKVISTRNGYSSFEKSIKGRVLKQVLVMGYLKVHLVNMNKGKSIPVHRFVAMSFIANKNNYPQVNHKDEDKTNNVVDNLEWCTVSYNNNYGTRNERISKNQKNDKKNKSILQFTLDGKFIKEWISITEASKNGHDRRSIQRCLKSEYKQHHNFIWKYK